MNWKNTSLCLCLGMLMGACSNDPVQTTDRGVILHLDKANLPTKAVRVEVMGDKIFRVSATANSAFADKPSLCVVPQSVQTPFTVVQTDTTVRVQTASLTAQILKSTGKVTFLNAAGDIVLSEDNAPRGFKPYTAAQGGTAYTVQQQFVSGDPNEGLYGLGQHQSDEFNYKGKNEELFQYNTKVSVPFIVSTAGYGLLWDSYSLCRFGTPEPYKQLGELFTLYDATGAPGALTGTYVPRDTMASPIIVRREDSLYFEHLVHNPADLKDNLSRVVNLPKGFPFYGSNVTYQGEIEAKESGLYQFILYYAGYMTVTIDGKEVVPERWRTAWNPNSYKFAVSLEAGKRVPFSIAWKPDGAVSYCGLRALAPVDDATRQKISWWGEMQDQIDYYFVAGDDMDDVIHGYRTLTGKSPVMPKWAMGYWQSRERYKTQEEILDALKGFRDRQIPIDNIVLDWSYWPEDKWGSHEFDAARFPDPKAMVDAIHNMNGHVMISVWPKFYDGIEHFKEFDAKGWMYRQAINDSIRDWIGQGYMGSFYDAYSADARKLFWHQMEEHLYTLGFDAWWMDASEPNIRDCTDIEYRKALCGPTALGPSDQYFNAYALMNAEAIYDGQREVAPNQRVFLLTRSGFAGLQRYSTATWSGDIATRWEDMKAQISAGLNFAVSGIPYWTMDIGGFCVESRYEAAQRAFDKTGVESADLKEWRELNTRWYQFGAFCPLYRAHGQFPYREAWNIAPKNHPCYQSIVYYTQLRYRLMPYIYSLAGRTYLDDYTIMRPLVMDFADDVQTHDVGDAYMFGPALMVAPVYSYGARQRSVYFPQGSDWFDFYTGTFVKGGQQLMVDAPYNRIPLYVRAGSIVPMGELMQYTDQKPADAITLYVYAGKDADFTLYEDEGTNYDYEKGAYSCIAMHYDEASRQLTLGARAGSYPGMLEHRTFNVVVIRPEAPRACDFAAQGKKVEYSGEAQTIQL